MNRLNKLTVLFLVIVFFQMPNFLYSQEETDETLKPVRVNVVKPYEPTISDAYKIMNNPVVTDSLSIRTVAEYKLKSKQYPAPFSLEPINAARISGSGEPLKKLSKGFVKAGFGNYSSPYGELFLHTLRSETIDVGLHAKHLSSDGKIDGFANTAFSDNEIGVSLNSFTKTHTWHAALDYKRSALHYYGFNPDSLRINENVDLEEIDYLQKFSLISLEGGVRSNYTDSSRIQHFLNFKVRNLKDYYRSEENNVMVAGKLYKKDSFLKLTPSQTIGVDFVADIYDYENTLFSEGHSLVKIAPFISATHEKLRLKAGINATTVLDSVIDLNFYPFVNIDFDLVKDVLFVYAGFEGGVKKSSFMSLTAENPFVNPTVTSGFVDTKMKSYGGFRGSFSSFMSFNVGLSLSVVDNMPFFVNDFDTNRVNNNSNKFNVEYHNVELLNAYAEIAYQKGNKWRFILHSEFNQYSLPDDTIKPWYKPSFETTFTLNYNLKDKIVLKADVFMCNGMFARTPELDSEIIELDGIIDANIGMEYRYTKNISAFLTFNNLGASSYNRWYNYPSYKFNLLGGLSFSF